MVKDCGNALDHTDCCVTGACAGTAIKITKHEREGIAPPQPCCVLCVHLSVSIRLSVLQKDKDNSNEKFKSTALFLSARCNGAVMVHKNRVGGCRVLEHTEIDARQSTDPWFCTSPTQSKVKSEKFSDESYRTALCFTAD